MKSTTILLHDNQGCLLVNSITIPVRVKKSRVITLHFGALTIELTIKLNHNLEPGTIMIPRKLTNTITIPDLPYDYYFQDNHLFVGPVIGMHISAKRDPRQYLNRFAQYDRIKGLILLFNERSINKTSHTIRGYYYNPSNKELVEGTFPYPSAIFNRAHMRIETYNHLREHIGNSIFNYPYGISDKWLLWEQMSQHIEIRNCLPLTTPYNDSNLRVMLQRFDEVYLKPTKLAGGKGIVQIKKSELGYTLKNTEGFELHTKSWRKLSSVINRNIIENNNYIIQQAIPFYHKGSKIDFRVYYQKDRSTKWRYSGMEAKIAVKGSIISNSKNRRKIRRGTSVLHKVYGLNLSQVKLKVEEISRIGIHVLNLMSTPDVHLGDVAMDIVIDMDYKVWLLEVQLNYTLEVKAHRGDDEKRILPYILPTPLEYARSLTGFNGRIEADGSSVHWKSRSCDTEQPNA